MKIKLLIPIFFLFKCLFLFSSPKIAFSKLMFVKISILRFYIKLYLRAFLNTVNYLLKLLHARI